MSQLPAQIAARVGWSQGTSDSGPAWLTIGTSAAELISGGGGLTDRNRLMVYCAGTIYLGKADTVTANTESTGGFPLAAGIYELDGVDTWYAIATENTDVCIWEAVV